ncbi:hypothetical protein BD410DRAFT_845255 [Rickenella mellea]|uniref:Fungal calcium binding protein domain-containing protein n=1 Tax=Rickenella mellea TaxID=50990 RepID=A0A4Y7PJX8_9AGAM|nr:hypothetical protein BD410DRAFT_845255 [Rickenella mellea]
MKFTILAVLAAVACTVTANPAAIKRGCDVLGCLGALAPAIAICAAAAAEEGANPAADAECFFEAANELGNPPSVCNGCL